MGFSPDFNDLDPQQLEKALVATREMVRMVLENDSHTENELAQELWGAAHDGH